METIVRTKKELEQAKESGAEIIFVKGELADKLKRAKKVAQLSGVALAALTAALGAATLTAPATGGISYLAAVPVAALTGVEIAAIIAAASLGIGLIVAIFMGYEEIEYSEGSLKLRKKRKA
ncbi:hypothetical protein LA366_14545 [Aeromonas jandaei]|uniref:Uncharacterized protein n=1 Tax=Aeromonas jandaei TaxID=650 RepID=A0A7T4ACU6_AERJA|nr:hypothetical protein [Aeromonas jandaei]QQB21508.1 hypothetical protein I6H43_08320 [Aeromonas jandaei]UCA32326.1 hypothetical protein LA366_14545 [Aeromonas jandaei]